MVPSIRGICVFSPEPWITISSMDTRDIRSGAPQWVWMAAIWLGLGLFDALQTVFVMRSERMHHAWLILFATVMFSWLP